MAQGPILVEGNAPEADKPPVQPVVVVDTTMRMIAIGSFLILLGTALFFARDFLLPVSLAFLFALILSPIVRTLRRKAGVPEPLTAIVLVIGVVGGLGLGSYFLTGPIAQWVADAPQIANELRTKIAVVRQPVEAVAEATAQVDELTATDDPTVQRVVVSEPGLLSRAATGAPEVAAKIGLTLILLLFLLASGDMFYEKLVRALPTMSDKKRGLRIARTVEREVSRYLFTITLINAGLGIAVGASMWVLGMPNPVLWGVVAALLNYIPYLGALIGIALVGAVALVSFDTLSYALLPPLAYFLCNVLESQIVTPTVVGRRLEMNSVAVFLAVAFWGWLWGIVGALIAVPLLVTVKVFCDHVDSLQALGEFLGARYVAEEPEETAPPAKAA